MADQAPSVPELPRPHEAAAKLQGKSPDDVTPAADDNPKMARDYTFQLDWTAPRGKRYVGEFINRVPNLGERRAIKVLKAQLLGHTPVAALDADAWHHAELVAHMTTTLIKRPEAFQDLYEIMDEGVLEALWEEVRSHEDIFLGREPDPGVGARPAQDGSGAA